MLATEARTENSRETVPAPMLATEARTENSRETVPAPMLATMLATEARHLSQTIVMMTIVVHHRW
jgi:hypothetical protein